MQNKWSDNVECNCNHNRVLEEALSIYGLEAQLKMAIEEMSELTKEICKHFGGRDNKKELAEEIADVEIMMEQLKIAFNCYYTVEDIKGAKIIRLKDRLKSRSIQKSS